jgi:hypothetical protein
VSSVKFSSRLYVQIVERVFWTYFSFGHRLNMCRQKKKLAS